MDFGEQNPVLKNDLDQVMALVRQAVNKSHPHIRPALADLTESGGKLLRPAFVILCARLGSFSPDQIYPAAAGMELLHLATLIHDDIMDSAETRRGKPTLHSRTGINTAVMGGDFLFSQALALTSVDQQGQNAGVLIKTVSRLCSSEIDQTSETGRFNISLRKYLNRIAGKTAAMFSLSAHVGAKTGGCTPRQIQVCRELGHQIGMAFQVRDDILDYTGDTRLMGKPTGNDLIAGIPTLPLLYGINSAMGPRIEAELAHWPFSKRRADRIVKLVGRAGGIDKAEQLEDRFREKALALIHQLPEGYTRTTFLELSEQIAQREN